MFSVPSPSPAATFYASAMLGLVGVHRRDGLQPADRPQGSGHEVGFALIMLLNK